MMMTTMTTIDVQAAFFCSGRIANQIQSAYCRWCDTRFFCGRPIGRREQELVFGIGIKEGLWNL